MNRAALILCLVFAGSATADPKGAVVRLPSHGGSGTVVSTGPGWSLILTAGHLYGKPQNPRVPGSPMVPDQQRIRQPMTFDIVASAAKGQGGSNLLGYDLSQDIALVRLNYGPLPHVAPVAPAGFRPGLCLSGGFDDMQFPGQWRTTHIIPDRGDGYTYTVEPPWHGRSGGGLIDANTGYLVGVCSGYTGAHSRDDRMRGKGVYASHASILAFLRRTNGIQVADEPQLSRPPQLFEQRACPT